MYAGYFGLSQEPFSIAPDPRYLFMSERHREALAHLLYGVGGGGGFVLLTGEIGTGKTTVCRCFLEQIPATCRVAYIFNPKLTALELLQTVCQEFGLQVPHREGGATVKDHVDALNAFLLAQHAAGQSTVLIIDEAQNLSADVLEQLRLLTNLETRERKLLQIMLIGQPELRTLLARPELEQLAQRVIARYHLDALTPAETTQYVRHRLEVAGLSRAVPFQARALALVHRLAGGVPRRINLLCDRSLLGAYAKGEAAVTPAIVRGAAREVFGALPRRTPAWRPWLLVGGGLVMGAVLAAAAHALLGEREVPAVPAAARAASQAQSAASAAASAPARGDAQPVSTVPAPAASAGAVPVLLSDERQAWRELAQVWGAPAIATDGEPCAQLAQVGLGCYTGRGLSLALLRRLDRPGLVTLDRDRGVPTYALLTGLGDTAVTLRAGGQSQTVTLGAFAQRWSGDWASLWARPPGWDPAAPGRETPQLQRWIEQRLAQDPALSASAAGGAPLRSRIRSFQLAEGMPADGLLGPLTFMQLQRRGGDDVPRLAR